MRSDRSSRQRPGLLPLWLALAFGAVTLPLAAQPFPIDEHERLDFDRPEAWAMRYGTAAVLVGSLDAAAERTPWSVELGIEAGWVPQLSAAERTVGFNGTKTEDLNKTEVFGRLRLDVGLPGRFTLTLAAPPPVEVGGVEPRLLGVALARPLIEQRSWRLGARLHGQAGTLDGDFTCDRATVAAGNDPQRNPYRCLEVSEDTLTTRYLGLDLVAAFPTTRLTPYVGLGYAAYDFEMQVRARYGSILDRTRQTTNGTGWHASAGITAPVAERFTVAVEAVYVPLDVVRPPRAASQQDDLLNVRAALRYRLR